MKKSIVIDHSWGDMAMKTSIVNDHSWGDLARKEVYCQWPLVRRFGNEDVYCKWPLVRRFGNEGSLFSMTTREAIWQWRSLLSMTTCEAIWQIFSSLVKTITELPPSWHKWLLTNGYYCAVLCCAQMIEYIMAQRSYSFVCTLHYLIIIIMQTCLKILKYLSATFFRACQRLHLFSQSSFMQYIDGLAQDCNNSIANTLELL